MRRRHCADAAPPTVLAAVAHRPARAQLPAPAAANAAQVGVPCRVVRRHRATPHDSGHRGSARSDRRLVAAPPLRHTPQQTRSTVRERHPSNSASVRRRRQPERSPNGPFQLRHPTAGRPDSESSARALAPHSAGRADPQATARLHGRRDRGPLRVPHSQHNAGRPRGGGDPLHHRRRSRAHHRRAERHTEKSNGARSTPCSVMIASISAAGVTSKAGLIMGLSSATVNRPVTQIGRAHV